MAVCGDHDEKLELPNQASSISSSDPLAAPSTLLKFLTNCSATHTTVWRYNLSMQVQLQWLQTTSEMPYLNMHTPHFSLVLAVLDQFYFSLPWSDLHMYCRVPIQYRPYFLVSLCAVVVPSPRLARNLM